MSNMIGADPAALRRMAQDFENCSAELQSISTRITPIVQDPMRWVGMDNQRFVDAWTNDHSRKISDVADRIRDAAVELKRNADEQDGASASTDEITDTIRNFFRDPSIANPLRDILSGGRGGWPWQDDPVILPSRIDPDFGLGDHGFEYEYPGFLDGLLPPHMGLSPDVFVDDPTALDAFSVLDGTKSFLESSLLGSDFTFADAVGRIPGVGDVLTASSVLHSLMDPDLSVLEKVDSVVMTGVDLLKDSPNPAVATFGSAASIWHYVGEKAAESDFSAEGVQAVVDEIAKDPVGSLVAGGQAVAKESLNIVNAVVPPPVSGVIKDGIKALGSGIKLGFNLAQRYMGGHG